MILDVFRRALRWCFSQFFTFADDFKCLMSVSDVFRCLSLKTLSNVLFDFNEFRRFRRVSHDFRHLLSNSYYALGGKIFFTLNLLDILSNCALPVVCTHCDVQHCRG